MSNLNTILVATDLSPLSMTAVARGLTLASEHRLKCIILNVLPRDLMFDLERLIGRPGLTFERDATERQTRALNSSVRDLIGARRLDVHTRLRCGKPAEEIARQALEDQADLIVVSSHGQGTFRRLLLGSTTMGVLQDSPCPVLVVRSTESQAYRKVILAIDFSDASTAVIQTALRYAPDAHFVLTHFLQAPFEQTQQLALLAPDQINTYRQAARDEAARQLDAIAQAHGLSNDNYSIEVMPENDHQAWPSLQERLQCDLIVTAKHGHHVTRDRLLGSFTQSVLSQAECDVLVVAPD